MRSTPDPKPSRNTPAARPEEIGAMADYTPREMMSITAARALKNDDVCFVGIGLPSEACNVARLTHAPGITLIYESGTIGTKPDVLPLSIGDGELCDTAAVTVPVPEMFRYWLQGGRITVGFLGAAELDRFGNINTTVIGDYQNPKVRLPGGGGAPEIATSCGEVFIVMPQSRRGFVETLGFVTSFGHGEGGDARAQLGLTTKGPTKLITDLCVMEPDPETREFTVTSLHPGVSRDDIVENTGWAVRFGREMAETPPPSKEALEVLRALKARTAEAHGEGGAGPAA
jgi:glutaconate CoA-transferase, subunit B